FIGRGNVGPGDVITVTIKDSRGAVVATFTSNSGGGIVVDKANSSWRIPEEAWTSKGLSLDRGTYTITSSTKTADGKGEQTGSSESFTIYKPVTELTYSNPLDDKASQTYAMPDGSYWLFYAREVSSANYDLFAQRYSQTGVKIGNEVIIANAASGGSNAEGHANRFGLNHEHQYDVHFNRDGSFVVFYERYTEYPYLAKFDAQGNLLSRTATNNTLKHELNQNYVQMDNGDYALFFVSGETNNYNIYMQRYRQDGSTLDSDPVKITTGSNQGNGYNAMLFDQNGYATGSSSTVKYKATTEGLSVANVGGDFMVMTYMTNKDRSLESNTRNSDIYMRVINFKTGQAVGQDILVTQNNKFYQIAPEIIALKDGTFVVLWASNHTSLSGNDGTMDDFNIYTKRYKLDNNNQMVALDTVEKRVNTTTDGVNGVGFDAPRAMYSMATLAHGGYVVTWTKFTSDKKANVYSQAFDAAGNQLGGETLVSTNSDANLDMMPKVSGLADGGYIITWSSASDTSKTWYDNLKGDIYSVIVNADGSIRGKGDNNIYPINASYEDGTGALEGNDGVNTLDGKNGAISFNAGKGNDYIIIYNTDFSFVEGGEGNDTLIWNSFDDLDLSLISNKVNSIDYLHLNDAYSNTLSLRIEDVLAMTPNDDHLLVIQGGRTDTVDLVLSDTEWSTLGAQQFRGETYNVYVHATDDAQVWIQQGIAVI
ncbi:hypothetical protein, partial [Thorsellia kenyensis]